MTFELTILGSSSALPTSNRFTSAHLLNIGERFFLIDCGEGTQIQLRKNKLSPAKISHIFISHLHGDHIFGLFGLLSSLNLMGRRAPIHLFGPENLKDLMDSHFKVFPRPEFELCFFVVEDDSIIYSDSKIEVKAIELSHRGPTYGYLFREKPKPLNLRKEMIEKYHLGIEQIKNIKRGKDLVLNDSEIISNSELTLPPFVQRSYAYISDTAFKPEIAEALAGVDLLYHEATFLEKDIQLASETKHSTARQAATIAKLASVKKLLLGHFSTRYKEEGLFEIEARDVFKNAFAVNDGEKYQVKQYRTHR